MRMQHGFNATLPVPHGPISWPIRIQSMRFEVPTTHGVASHIQLPERHVWGVEVACTDPDLMDGMRFQWCDAATTSQRYAAVRFHRLNGPAFITLGEWSNEVEDWFVDGQHIPKADVMEFQADHGNWRTWQPGHQDVLFRLSYPR